jgi:hypothetical protein
MSNQQKSKKSTFINYSTLGSIRVYRSTPRIASLFAIGLYVLFVFCPFVTVTTPLGDFVARPPNDIFDKPPTTDEDYIAGFDIVLRLIAWNTTNLWHRILTCSVFLLPHLCFVCVVTFDLTPAIMAISEAHKTRLNLTAQVIAIVGFCALLLNVPVLLRITEQYHKGSNQSELSMSALLLPAAFLMLLVREWRTPAYKKQ